MEDRARTTDYLREADESAARLGGDSNYRAFNQTGRRDDAIATVLDAESMAPEQVRHHYLGRQLVLGWVRTTVGSPPVELDRLARRMRVVS